MEISSNQHSFDQNHAQEDYIDMEVSSSSNLLCCSSGSTPHNREFEFQMCSLSQDTESTTSPADELFYKGKLLPLHLPPRLEMVQKLLQGSSAATLDIKAEESYTSPSISRSTNSSTALCTPSDSGYISPSESYRASCELNPDEHFLGWTNENSNINLYGHSKKSWSKRLKQSSLGQKIKASRAYLKSFFSKPGCSEESCAKALDNQVSSKGQECSSKVTKIETRKTTLAQIDNKFQTISTLLVKNIEREFIEDYANTITHRRSFSGVIQRHPAQKSSSPLSSSGSSSSSLSFSFSHGFCDLQLLKRSSSASPEIDISIQEAIAHCKQSQQLLSSRSPTKKIQHCSFSTSRISASMDQDRARLCRI